jgi:hypothetical protein
MVPMWDYRLGTTRGKAFGKTAAGCVPERFHGQQEPPNPLLQVAEIIGVFDSGKIR